MTLALSFQKNKLIEMIENQSDHLFDLILGQEAEVVLLMSESEIRELFPNSDKDSSTLKEELILERNSFWKESFKDPENIFKALFPLIEDKMKRRLNSFDIINGFILQESIH